MANIKGRFDLAVIGGGIVGLATARQALIKHPKLKLCIIEKEKELASHQSKRNSGVVHCGIYYRKGSLKSKFCIAGARQMKAYCLSKNLDYKECGKLIVATQRNEIPILHQLYSNATANGIEGIEMINPERIQAIQPGCTNAIEAIWSPKTAIVDWHKVALSYAEEVVERGGKIITNYSASKFYPATRGVQIEHVDGGKMIEASSVVTCAGVYSDYFARQTNNKEHPKVVPFKGNYYSLSDRLSKSINTNIYPVPNPKLPFLGVHITPRVDGSVLVGPTALLTLGYEKYSDEVPTRLLHVYHILIRSGLKKMLFNRDNLKAGLQELWRFYSKDRFTAEVQGFLPDLKSEDLIDDKFCGIRAQVVEGDGTLVDDFLIETGVEPALNRIIHLRNCPSPAATSSLAIAERVVSILEERLI